MYYQKDQIDRFLQSTIKKVSKDDLLRKAKFDYNKENIVKKCCEAIIHDERTFIENSKEIAAYLFDIMKVNSEMDSCDLVVCLYTVKDQRRIALIKLDYKASYNHSIEFIDDKFNIQMKLNEEVISGTKKPKQCALVGISSLNSEYDLDILDKELKYNFIESMKNNNLSNFNIDKKIATKMLKNRILKTNTGIKISAKLEDIRNNLNFIIKENGNGSYDLVVKNVEFAEVN